MSIYHVLDAVNKMGKKEIVLALKESQSSEGQALQQKLNEDNRAPYQRG